MGRNLIILGLALAAIGVLFTLGEKLPIQFGRLPGDIRWEGKNGSFYFPIVTCLLISLLATLVMWIIGRFR